MPETRLLVATTVGASVPKLSIRSVRGSNGTRISWKSLHADNPHVFARGQRPVASDR